MLPMFPKVDPIFVPRIFQMADFEAKKNGETKMVSQSAGLFVTFSPV